MRKFNKFLLKLMGWKIDEATPEGVQQAVVCMGPHTSNWDFIIGRMAFRYYGVTARFLIKKELFFFPLGWLLKRMGGIPVDRKKAGNFTDTASELFQKYDDLYLVFTPEGTRSYSPKWKKGFYYIAIKAKVPIYIAYMDYSNKTGGFKELFVPTGDAEADLKYIKKVLSQFQGKFPENGIKADD